MTNETLWLINLFKKTSYKNFFIKSFYKSLNGRIWDDTDLRGATHVTSHAYISLCNWRDEIICDGLYLYAEKSDGMPASLIEFDFTFKHAGTLSIPLDKLKNEVFDELCKAIFIQLMLLVSKGWAIKLGLHGQHLIEPYTEVLSLIECDMSIE